MEKSIVIMAAGMGSRYGGLKQIDSMGPSGEILMEYAVYDAIRAEFPKVVFIIKPNMKEEFHKRIGSRLEKHIEIAYAFQSLDDLPRGYSVPPGREKPWGTSHAILCAREQLNDAFAVFNADDYYGSQAFGEMGRFLDGLNPDADTLQCAMVGYKIENTLSAYGTVTRGICSQSDNYLIGVDEIDGIARNADGVITHANGILSGQELCSMNYWGFPHSIFDWLEKKFRGFLDARGTELKSEWLIPKSIDRMVHSGEGRVVVLSSGDNWFGVTYPQDKPTVQQRLKTMADVGEYPSPLFK